VTASRAWAQPISRRPQLAARLATLASPQAAFPMEPLTMSDVNIQGTKMVGEWLNGEWRGARHERRETKILLEGERGLGYFGGGEK